MFHSHTVSGNNIMLSRPSHQFFHFWDPHLLFTFRYPSSAFLFPLLPAFQNQSFSFFYNNAFFFRIRIWFLLLELDQSIPFCSNLIFFWHTFTLSIKVVSFPVFVNFADGSVSVARNQTTGEFAGGEFQFFKSCRWFIWYCTRVSLFLFSSEIMVFRF